jgi:hypothetical protein
MASTVGFGSGGGAGCALGFRGARGFAGVVRVRVDVERLVVERAAVERPLVEGGVVPAGEVVPDSEDAVLSAADDLFEVLRAVPARAPEDVVRALEDRAVVVPASAAARVVVDFARDGFFGADAGFCFGVCSLADWSGVGSSSGGVSGSELMWPP